MASDYPVYKATRNLLDDDFLGHVSKVWSTLENATKAEIEEELQIVNDRVKYMKSRFALDIESGTNMGALLQKVEAMQLETKNEIQGLKEETKGLKEETKNEIQGLKEETKGLKDSLAGKVVDMSSQSRPNIARIMNEQALSRTKMHTPISGKESVLTKKEQIQATEYSKVPLIGETMLVAFLTPFIHHVFENTNRVFVNSEDHPWLDPGFGGDKRKPDGFICHSSSYTNLVPNRKGAVLDLRESLIGNELRFGVPSSRVLWDSICVVEAKPALDKIGQLELVEYMQFLSSNIICGMLIGNDGFWLIEAHKGAIFRRITAKWTDEGSAELMRNFFPISPWENAILKVCEELHCKIVEPPVYPDETTVTAFLGSGLTGRVFKAQMIGGLEKEVAVKVVLWENIDLLDNECEIIGQYTKIECIVSILSKVKVKNVGGGYVMTPVGQCIASEKQPDPVELFKALFSLHYNGIVHGDARLANLIRNLGKVLWIDFMHVGVATVSNFCKDCVCLATSLLRHGNIVVEGNTLPETISSAISNYRTSQSEENILKIADEVANVISAKTLDAKSS